MRKWGSSKAGRSDYVDALWAVLLNHVWYVLESEEEVALYLFRGNKVYKNVGPDTIDRWEVIDFAKAKK